MSSLRLYKLSKSFTQGVHSTRVLDNATYTFSQSQNVAITGVSGTGKSTLLHMLAGFDTPSSGSIFFDDTDIYQFDSAKRQFFLQKIIGLIFQSPYLIDELSVVENVMIKGLLAQQPYKLAALRAYELLECVGLSDKGQSAPRTLSGGEQQRIALARALYNEPAFILADEPTAHLDSVTKNSIMNLLLACRRQWGMGLIIATHDESVAQQMDVVLRLDKGQLIEQRFQKAESVLRKPDQLPL